MLSKVEIIHVFNHTDESHVIEWADDLVQTTSSFASSSKHSFKNESILIEKLEGLNATSVIHYHDLKSAVSHQGCREPDLRFGVDFADFTEPNPTKEHSASETRILDTQAWILENARFIIVRNKSHIRKIEDWFIEQPVFGGGEFYYNYDNAQKIATKCHFQPYLINEKRFDFEKVSKNKILWVSAVHGVDLEYVYLSMSGKSVNWQKVKDFCSQYELDQKKVRFLVFTSLDHNQFRALLNRKKLPGSNFVLLNPSRTNLPSCLEMARAHIDFSSKESEEEDLLQTAQGMMGKYIISPYSESKPNLLTWDDTDSVLQLIKSEPKDSTRIEIREAIIETNGLHSNYENLGLQYASVFEDSPI